MEEYFYVLCTIVGLFSGIVIGLCVKLSFVSERMRQLEADRHFHSRDIQRLERLTGGPPKPPDSRFAFEMYGHEVFYERSK